MVDVLTIAAFVITSVVIFWIVFQLRASWHDSRRRQAAAGRTADAAARVERGGGVLVESLAEQLPQPKAYLSHLDQDLRRAGHYWPRAREEYLAYRNALVILAILGAGVVCVLLGPEREEIVVRVLMGGLLAAVLCWGLPRLFLKAKGRRRVERVRRALPYALDLLTMCMSGGMSLQDALAHVSRDMALTHPDLADELQIIRQQADLTSLELALRQFSQRIDAPEVASIAALITQGQRLGANLVGSLQDYADGLRLKWRQSADEHANKVGVQVLFPLVFCLLPAALAMLVGPALLELDAARGTVREDLQQTRSRVMQLEQESSREAIRRDLEETRARVRQRMQERMRAQPRAAEPQP
jgi:tight adherence protein C